MATKDSRERFVGSGEHTDAPEAMPGDRFVVVVHQMGGPVDDEQFVGPFRSRSRAIAWAQRLERAGESHDVVARVRLIHRTGIAASEVVGWYP